MEADLTSSVSFVASIGQNKYNAMSPFSLSSEYNTISSLSYIIFSNCKLVVSMGSEKI